jgi:hypothetical protein
MERLTNFGYFEIDKGKAKATLRVALALVGLTSFAPCFYLGSLLTGVNGDIGGD